MRRAGPRRRGPRPAARGRRRADGIRLLARTERHRPGGDVVVVVGESLEQRRGALEGLHTLLAIGGPLALLLASLAGYAVAAGRCGRSSGCAAARRR